MENLGLIISAIGVAVAAVSGIVGVVWRLSTKIYQVEIWARDEFVRKSSFEIAISRMEKSMESMATKVETAVEKMSRRFEKVDH
ncbi:hypothetical protein [Bradyrhizobium sp.]|uniref:hypothetical protein n=1 Tax=Bradyrhizobium sp. TaxID=376 RepID=UPI0039E54E07